MSGMIDLLQGDTYSYNRRKKLFPIIVQVGVGGTGSNLAQQVAQMLGMYTDQVITVLLIVMKLKRKIFETSCLWSRMSVKGRRIYLLNAIQRLIRLTSLLISMNLLRIYQL
ncbi:hypothetical protein ACTHPV_26715 [Ferdinandcohnia sp. SAFN-114]